MDVTVGDERFDRYYRRIRLGLRLMQHGARAQTASDWSGLTPGSTHDASQTLDARRGRRFRGPAPSSYKPFFRSELKASHAAMFVGIHCMVGPKSPTPSLEGGEKLCEAYEIYREWEPEGTTRVRPGRAARDRAPWCTRRSNSPSAPGCGCALLIDKFGKRRTACAQCRHNSYSANKSASRPS